MSGIVCSKCGAWQGDADSGRCTNCGDELSTAEVVAALPDKLPTEEPELVQSGAQTAPVPVTADSSDDQMISAVMARLEGMQGRRTNWLHTVFVLGMTFILFSVAGLFQNGPVELILLVLVLFVHESGHYLGMRWFNYQNVQMFFIPFFGAAVSGRQTSTSASHEAIVVLLGPLPGIVLGVALWILATIRPNALTLQVSQLLVLINAFNLLPFLPLDGGRLLHLVLFSRQRHLEAAFQILAGGALALIGWSLGTWLLVAIGVWMVMTTAVIFRNNSIAQQLRPTLAILADDDLAPDTVPRSAAAQIVLKLRERLPNTTDPDVLASAVSSIWQRLRTQPPGVFASFTLLGVYVAGLLAPILAIDVYRSGPLIGRWSATMTEFTSTNGGFAVLLPGTPEERTESLEYVEYPQPRLRDHRQQVLLEWSPRCVRTLLLEQPNKTALCVISYADVAPHKVNKLTDTNAALETCCRAFAASVGIKEEFGSPIHLNGHPGRELLIIRFVPHRPVFCKVRIYLAGQRLYLLQYISDASEPGRFNTQMSDQFLESFRLLAK